MHVAGMLSAGGGPTVDLDADAASLLGVIHEVFTNMDSNGTGTIVKSQLEECVTKSGIHMEDGQLEAAMRYMDELAIKDEKNKPPSPMKLGERTASPPGDGTFEDESGGNESSGNESGGGTFENESDTGSAKSSKKGYSDMTPRTKANHLNFKLFAKWMMSTNELAVQLRQHWKSNVLGGTQFSDLVDEDDLARKNRMFEGHSRGYYRALDKLGNMDHMQSIWIFMEEPETSLSAFYFSIFIQFLIFVSSVLFICDTIQTWRNDETFALVAKNGEYILVGIFTVEYLTRVFTCTHRPGEDKGLLSYLRQGMNCVDLAAISPTYIELMMGGGAGLAVLRILRMARIIRVVKVGTFKENLLLVIEGLNRSVTGLILLVYLVVIFMVVMASMSYQLEHDSDAVCAEITAGGGDCSKFTDIPTTFWFVIVTMTSVGYGDMFPYSDGGRAVGAIIMLSGILTLAVPITLISNKFNYVWIEAKALKRKEATIHSLINGFSIEEDDKKVDPDEPKKMTPVASRLFTAQLLLKQSYAFTSDDRFLAALSVIDGPDLPEGLPVTGAMDVSRIQCAISVLRQSYSKTGDERFAEALRLFEAVDA